MAKNNKASKLSDAELDSVQGGKASQAPVKRKAPAKPKGPVEEVSSKDEKDFSGNPATGCGHV